jgi:hypothetical protein
MKEVPEHCVSRRCSQSGPLLWPIVALACIAVIRTTEPEYSCTVETDGFDFLGFSFNSQDVDGH